jgi:SnoaL-like domain
MPWFPEMSSAPELARRYAQGAVPLYEGVLEASPDELLRSWAGEPWLDDPRLGRITDRDGFEEWSTLTRDWLVAHDAQLRPVDLIKTPGRTVEEVAIDLAIGGERRELPVAVAADRTADGHLTAIRIYHSMWPLIEDHRIREPMLHGDPDLIGPDIVGEYQRALAAGDLEGILATYEDDAVVREPAGGPYVYGGRENFRRIYTLQFANGGGIPLERCQITDDGRACALEYNVVRWGVTEMTPQAGLAVYVRGETGKLAYGRIYDDAAPPAVSDSSEADAEPS